MGLLLGNLKMPGQREQLKVGITPDHLPPRKRQNIDAAGWSAAASGHSRMQAARRKSRSNCRLIPHQRVFAHECQERLQRGRPRPYRRSSSAGVMPVSFARPPPAAESVPRAPGPKILPAGCPSRTRTSPVLHDRSPTPRAGRSFPGRSPCKRFFLGRGGGSLRWAIF